MNHYESLMMLSSYDLTPERVMKTFAVPLMDLRLAHVQDARHNGTRMSPARDPHRLSFVSRESEAGSVKYVLWRS